MSDRFNVPEKDKDPNYIYRWCNTDERAMLQRLEQGYQVVKFDAPEIPSLVKGEAEPAPGGVARRRGSDLILCRIHKDVFEERIESKRRSNRDKHAGVIDDMVARARENAEQGLRNAGLKIPEHPLVFKDTAERFKT